MNNSLIKISVESKSFGTIIVILIEKNYCLSFTSHKIRYKIEDKIIRENDHRKDMCSTNKRKIEMIRSRERD